MFRVCGGVESAADEWFGDVASGAWRDFVPTRGKCSCKWLGGFPGGRGVAVSAAVALV